MVCPHCSTTLKYKERSGNTCSSCYKYFAFEPKTHPLNLSDNYFSSAVKKLSNYDKLFFTPQQLQFAVSRKKMKSSSAIVVFIIVGIISTIIASIIFLPIGLLVLLFWIILIISWKLFKTNIFLPQTPQDFKYSVLDTWRDTYKTLPSKLLVENSESEKFGNNLNGILFCQDFETAMCLNANQMNEDLKLAITSKQPQVAKLMQIHKNLPIYVLHDASTDGIEFWEKTKHYFNGQTKVFDIGLHPQAVMKSKLMKFREKSINSRNFSSLSSEENAWLKQGHYTPLFVLKPEKLIKYVTDQIARKSKFVKADDAEKTAQNIGFMTWVNE